MLDWLRHKLTSPSSGLDFHRVTSSGRAEALCARGELRKTPLLPVGFGGDEAAPNLCYLTPLAAELKERLERETILPLARDGRFTRYEVQPEYAGRSVVPTRLSLVASVPGFLVQVIDVWPGALSASAVRAAASPLWTPLVTDVHTLAPEALVRAFLADYERWNDFAHAAAESDRAGRADAARTMDAAERGYAALLAAYASPGFQGEPIAFGSTARQSPAQETISHVDVQDDIGVIRTQATREMPGYTLTSAYVYHLRRANGRWYLHSLQLVDETGTYEGL